MSEPVRRILVVGTTGSGKTTVASELARLGGLPHTELDTLRYERDWREVATADFCEQVAAVAATDAWIIDGNYAAVRQLTWSRAQLVVWLDYPLPVIFGRLLRRTLRRLATRSNARARNPERLGRLFGRRSILLWALRSHAPLRQEYELAAAERTGGLPHIARHRSAAQTDRWLRGLEADLAGAPPPGGGIGPADRL